MITPYFDSLLVKVTAHAPTFEDARAKLMRALREHRIRGVSTNIPFLLNVLGHPTFASGAVTTRFIESHPELLTATGGSQNRGEKLLRYLSAVAVNGPEPGLGATGPPTTMSAPTLPRLPLASSPMRLVLPVEGGGRATAVEVGAPAKPYLRDVLVKHGPSAFAKAVRDAPNTLVTDTTWRDAHQSLLATRVRTRDMLAIAPATRQALAHAYSLECWCVLGGGWQAWQR